jgi:toxin ParE1/3/4
MARRDLVERPLARSDVVQQYAYIAVENEAAAERFLDAVESTYRQLVRSPEIGHEYTTMNPRLGGIRVWPVRSFRKMLVFYRVSPRAVEVIRVLHGARDIDAIFGE